MFGTVPNINTYQTWGTKLKRKINIGTKVKSAAKLMNEKFYP